MKAYSVIDLVYGDSGKGLVTDTLCSDALRPLVIRHSGGSNAGHTVWLDEKLHHTHSSFGSGALRGKDSYFSKHTSINLINLKKEYEVLNEKVSYMPKLYLDPEINLILPYDQIINQNTSINKFNTTGVGLGQSMKRKNDLNMYVSILDVFNIPILREKMESIKHTYCNLYHMNYTDLSVLDDEFLECVTYLFVNQVFEVKSLKQIYENYDELIFEGSQGILLDKDYGIFPDVTYANTTNKNVIEILSELKGIDSLEVYYVSRSYGTRHGVGHIPGAYLDIKNEHEHNEFNKWQGPFKYFKLKQNLLTYSMSIDNTFLLKSDLNITRNLVTTCTNIYPIPKTWYFADCPYINGYWYTSKSRISDAFYLAR